MIFGNADSEVYIFRQLLWTQKVLGDVTSVILYINTCDCRGFLEN